ncbi:hypothetical protein FD687_01270 [Apilactobacillus kunkeei]|nr:hypothetical protein FD687_01270 [Apilactobacillus kunkeei]TMT04228.1 hypothetical protein FD689_01405 [Apilactobacillus kunkeei]
MKSKKVIISVISIVAVIILGSVAFASVSHNNKQSNHKSAQSSSSKATSTTVSTNSSSSTTSSMSSSSSSQKKPVKQKEQPKQYTIPIPDNPVYKPITHDFYGNWYYGNQAKIQVGDYIFRGDHPTDPVSGPGPLVMERYRTTNAVYIRSLYEINTYWPATLKVNGDESYNVMVTSNADKFNDFKIYTSVPTKKPIKEYVFKQSHPELVDKKFISTDELDSLK